VKGKTILILVAVAIGGFIAYQELKRPGGYTIAGFTLGRSE